MTFKQAKNFRIPFGDNKGKTIDEVAASDSGLRDLDNLLGWMEDKDYKGVFRIALTTYLSDDSIKRDLDDND